MRGEPKVAVKFIRKNAPYNVGEIAGFPEGVAQRLIARKRAVLYEPDEQQPAEAPAKKEAVQPPAKVEDAPPVEETEEPKPKAAPKKKKSAVKKK
jgi:hypothetical protein